MTTTVFFGIFSMGFVFGYLLYYAIRHTKEFNIDLLASAIGAIGGGTVVGLLGKTSDWIGPYGLGIAVGFLFYLFLVLIFSIIGRFDNLADKKVLFASQALLGAPRNGN